MSNEERILKILTINTVVFMRGGMSTVIMNYFENIDKSRIHIDFVVNREIEAEYRNGLEKGGSRIYLLERNAEPVRYFFNLLKIIKKENYDIVHVHGNSCTMVVELSAAMICHCKKRIAHSHNSSCSHKKIHKLMRPFFEMSCTDRLACSEEAGKWLFQDKKYTVIENAMDLNRYRFDVKKRKDIRRKIGVEETDILLGHVGYFNEQKNQNFLIDLLEILLTGGLPYKLILVGEDGGLKMEVERYAREKQLDGHVTFYGGTDDVVGIMSAMDIFLFPSKWEGLGIVMIEAQLSGLPCIASRQVSEATRITDNCQYLELSPEIWCDAVRGMQNKETDRSGVKISADGKKRFDIREQVGKLESIYFGENESETQAF